MDRGRYPQIARLLKTEEKAQDKPHENDELEDWGPWDPKAWVRISDDPVTERSTNYDEDNCERSLIDQEWKCTNDHTTVCVMSAGPGLCGAPVNPDTCVMCSVTDKDWYSCPCGRRFHSCAGTVCPDCGMDCEQD